MESNINLLPEKDKQLKRDFKPPKDVVEMSTPQDRVFQERVVRIGGVVEFFKSLFKRKPTALPKTKPAPPAPDPSVQFPAPKPTIAAGPVTRMQTMPERLAPAPKPPKSGNFFTRLFRKRTETPRPVKQTAPVTASIPVPPPPLPKAAPTVPAPTTSIPVPRQLPPVPPPPPAPTMPRREAWSPPAPTAVGSLPPVPLPPISKPDAAPSSRPATTPLVPPAPAPKAASSLSEVTPIMGAGLNVNLVPQEYQPEAPSKNRLVALIAVSIAVVLVGGATIGLTLYRKSLDKKIADLDALSASVGQQISALESGPLQQALVLRQRTTEVTKALDQHVYWDTFFANLEAVTLPTVAYTSMSADVGGSVTMAATATSFDEVGKQLLTYQQATSFITQATILSATKATASAAQTAPGQSAAPAREIVTFSVSLRVAPQTFYHTR